MASIKKYATAEGERWRVQYRTPDHRVTQGRGFKTKKEAEDFAATVHVSKLRGEYIDASDARVTIGDLGPDWLAPHAPQTVDPAHRTERLAQPRPTTLGHSQTRRHQTQLGAVVGIADGPRGGQRRKEGDQTRQRFDGRDPRSNPRWWELGRTLALRLGVSI